MSITELTGRRRDEVRSIAARHGVASIAVFGSVARGEPGDRSDVDFLVEFEPGRSLGDLVTLWEDLESALGCPVDIVEKEGLHWFIRDQILKDAVPL